jgi:CheY-specific phosphatase CheX
MRHHHQFKELDMQLIQVDETIVNILTKSTRDGLAMAGIKPVPIGVSRYVTNTQEVSAIVGLVGSTSGAVMINAGKAAACFLATKMLAEEYTELTPQVLDCMSEIANIVAGQTKALLATTEWKTEKISCPSVVVGSSYYISHYKGMQSTSVDFELMEMPINTMHSRIISASISLMKL